MVASDSAGMNSQEDLRGRTPGLFSSLCSQALSFPQAKALSGLQCKTQLQPRGGDTGISETLSCPMVWLSGSMDMRLTPAPWVPQGPAVGRIWIWNGCLQPCSVRSGTDPGLKSGGTAQALSLSLPAPHLHS